MGRLNGSGAREWGKTASLLTYGGTYAGAYLLRRGLFMPEELELVMDEGWAREGLRRLQPLAQIKQALQPAPRTPFAKVAALEASFYMRNQLLRDTDWASMAHSLEIRVPLVDHLLLRTMSRIAFRPGAGKRSLSASPSPPLPEQIRLRPKSGFTTPIQLWMSAVSPPENVADSRSSIRGHWSRRWAIEVARGYDVDASRPIEA
jgi:asparagine synthase (glutamine-hydrolysing)